MVEKQVVTYRTLETVFILTFFRCYLLKLGRQGCMNAVGKCISVLFKRCDYVVNGFLQSVATTVTKCWMKDVPWESGLCHVCQYSRKGNF